MPLNIKRIKRKITYTAGIVLLALAMLLPNLISPRSEAADLRKFEPGNIMSDAVMSNKSTMTVQQIQNFLLSKNSCNDRSLSRLTRFNNADRNKATIGYLDSTLNGSRFTYQYKLKDGAFLCMAKDSFNGESAAQIIWKAAQDYNINPQVIIVLLQKEQGLITDTWPNHIQYRAATGYGCPDTAACDSQYYGLKNQIRQAASLFRTVLNGGWSNYPVGQNYVQYNPSASCGGSWINIQNRATSALYRYTPYQPNKAALDAGYGTAPCGAYGNRNFWLYFNDWFGNTNYTTRGAINIKHSSVSSLLGSPTSNEMSLKTGGVYQRFEGGLIYWKGGVGAWVVRGGIGNKYIGLKADSSPLGYPTSDETSIPSGGAYQQFEKGRIYWKSGLNTSAVYGAISSKYIDSNSVDGRLGFPTSDEVVVSSGAHQQFEGGRIYWKGGVGAWVVRGGIGNKYTELKTYTSPLGYPAGDEVPIPSGGVYQQFENGKIYWKPGKVTSSVLRVIDNKYISVGAGDGRLGHPTSEETPISTGAYQQFENGRIYRENDTNVNIVEGEILSMFANNENSISIYGFPSSDQVSNADGVYQHFTKQTIHKAADSDKFLFTSGGIRSRHIQVNNTTSGLGFPTDNSTVLSDGVYQNFKKGSIYWKRGVGAWEVNENNIHTYNNYGATTGLLGYPTASEKLHSDNESYYQPFEKGSIHRSTDITFATRGGINTKYLSLKDPTKRIGLPAGNEVSLETGGVYQQFEKGRIYWKSGLGTNIVSGGIGNKYIEMKADASRLGYPTGDEVALPSGGAYQQFEKGRIYWKRGIATTSTYGAIGNRYLGLGASEGRLGYPISEEIEINNGSYQKFEKGQIIWKNSRLSVVIY